MSKIRSDDRLLQTLTGRTETEKQPAPPECGEMGVVLRALVRAGRHAHAEKSSPPRRCLDLFLRALRPSWFW